MKHPGLRLLEQPTVILGGFLSSPTLYRTMSRSLQRMTGQPVWVVDASTLDWMSSVSMAGWAHLLQKLDRKAKQAVPNSPTGRITLVGHSSGGIVARLYLAPEPFRGRAYCGLERVSLLITLGSPHQNQRVGRIRQWVNQRYPGTYYTPSVRYVSVAGKSIRGSQTGSVAERWAYYSYARLCGEGQVWGDGLVPIQSAHLAGSQQITLDQVSHFGIAGKLWYGSEIAVSRWWQEIQSALYHPGDELL